MPSYETSGGVRLSKSTIDKRIKEGKKKFYEDTLFMKGWIACEVCGKSGGDYIDISHIISVKAAQESGRSELAWKTDNMQFLCREHHIEFDNKRNEEREKIYNKNNYL